LNSDNFSVNADSFLWKSRKSIDFVEKIEIGNLFVKSRSNEINLLNSIDGLVPFLVQSFVKSILCKNLNFNKNNIGSIEIISNIGDKKSRKSEKLSKFIIIPSVGDRIVLNSGYSKESKSFSVCTEYKGDKYSVLYWPDKRRILCSSDKYKNMSFDGTVVKDGLKGDLKLGQNLFSIESNLTHDSVFLCATGEILNNTMNCNMKYCLNDKFIHVFSVEYGPFVVDQFAISTKTSEVSDVDVKFPKGLISIKNLNLSAENWCLGNCVISDLDLSVLQEFFKSDVSGILNGSLDFKDKTEKIKLFLSNVNIYGVNLPKINVSGKYIKDKLDIDCEFNLLKKKCGAKASVSASNWKISRDSKLSASSKGSFYFADLFPKSESFEIEGKMKYDLSLGGNLSSPKVSGAFSIKDLKYVNYVSKTIVKEGRVSAVVRNNEVIFDKIFAKDCADGRVEGYGKIARKSDSYHIDSKINVHNFAVFDMRPARGVLFGELNISGPIGKSVKIGGALHFEKMLIDISSVIDRANRSLGIIDASRQQILGIHEGPDNPEAPIRAGQGDKPDLRCVPGCVPKSHSKSDSDKQESGLHKGSIKGTISSQGVISKAEPDDASVVSSSQGVISKAEPDGVHSSQGVISKSKSGRDGISQNNPVHLDINITAKNGVVIKGGGLDSFWSGYGRLYGDIKNPKYQIELPLQRGTISVSGRDLKLSHGKISVNSDSPKVFLVDILAVKKLGNLKLCAKFHQDKKGNFVKLYSDPMMPEKDVLSYFLFDKRASEATDAEGLSLLLVLGSSSESGSFNILEKFRKICGIDSISIKKNTDKNNSEYNSVSIGKKIGRLKVSVEQGIDPESRIISVGTNIGKWGGVSAYHSRGGFGIGSTCSFRY
jgi:hypothetical protein